MNQRLSPSLVDIASQMRSGCADILRSQTILLSLRNLPTSAITSMTMLLELWPAANGLAPSQKYNKLFMSQCVHMVFYG